MHALEREPEQRRDNQEGQAVGLQRATEREADSGRENLTHRETETAGGDKKRHRDERIQDKASAARDRTQIETEPEGDMETRELERDRN